MKKKISVTVAGQELRLSVDADEDYMQKVAAMADQKIKSAMESSGASSTQALLLACLNIIDDLLKAQELTEHLRAQLKDYIEEASKNKMEITDLRRENNRLRKEAN